MDVTVRMRSTKRHPKQREFVRSAAKRKVIRAGRRGGKTVGMAILALQEFLAGHRVLYATPTQEQVDTFWSEVKRALAEPLALGLFYKNESRHIIELSGTQQRIRAKTAWNADSLRGDYADLLILDEYQLMSEDAWNKVGAPMLLDNDGNAVFVYTKVRGRHHSHQLFQTAEEREKDGTGRWETFVFTSFDNPFNSREALGEIASDMTHLAYQMEILAEDIGDDPNALFRRDNIEEHRLLKHPILTRIVVGVDPPGGIAECGIVVAGKGRGKHAFVLEDPSLAAPPDKWAKAAVTAFHKNKADRIVGETNYGGDMVEHTIRTVDPDVSYKAVHASRGKQIRAEPVAALYEQGRVHHVGPFGELEDEMCTWVPGEGMASPNRLDALVWALTELMLEKQYPPVRLARMV